MKRWLIGVSLAVLACAAQALPTVAQVESEVQKGNYAQAQSMMHDVVVAKPGSARAHYIYAEILAHNDQFGQAAQEAALAKQLDPALKFTSADKFAAFEQLLEREQQRAARGARNGAGLDNLGPAARSAPAMTAPVMPRETAPVASGLPGWIWPAGLVLLAVLAWNWLRRSRTAGAGPAAATAGYGPAAGYAPGGFPTGPVPPAGGGWMGTGLAAAGGVAAGMLAEKLLERGHDGRRDEGSLSDGSYAPVESADTDARALENRNVDFGGGGNDWDDGSGSGGGSVDLGGGGDDGGW